MTARKKTNGLFKKVFEDLLNEVVQTTSLTLRQISLNLFD